MDVVRAAVSVTLLVSAAVVGGGAVSFRVVEATLGVLMAVTGAVLFRRPMLFAADVVPSGVTAGAVAAGRGVAAMMADAVGLTGGCAAFVAHGSTVGLVAAFVSLAAFVCLGNFRGISLW